MYVLNERRLHLEAILFAVKHLKHVIFIEKLLAKLFCESVLALGDGSQQTYEIQVQR